MKKIITPEAFLDESKKAFAFLAEDYQFRTEVEKTRHLGAEARFLGQKAGVRLYWSAYDEVLEVDVVRLIGGEVPPAAILLKQHAHLFWLSLASLLEGFGEPAPVQPCPISSKAAVTEALIESSKCLERLGGGLLVGDFTILNERYAAWRKQWSFSSGPPDLSDAEVQDWGMRRTAALGKSRQVHKRKWK